MTEKSNNYENSLLEVLLARQEAERLRDQLLAEYNRLEQDQEHLSPAQQNDPRTCRGQEAMRKAILATNRALESIDHALREMERVRDEET